MAMMLISQHAIELEEVRMKIKKTVTQKVIVANRENGRKGTGSKTQRGKDLVSRNATKHGILARNFRFKDDQEKAVYETLISDLDRTIDRDDPLQRMLTEEVVMAHVRRGRALKLEQRQSLRQNPATELALRSIENSDLVDTGVCLVDPESGWQCTELTMGAKKAGEHLARNGPLAQSSGDGHQLQFHAKFQDPMDKALRYQRATARDFYRALNLLCKLRKEEKPSSRD
jgi:hypothetical protein